MMIGMAMTDQSHRPNIKELLVNAKREILARSSSAKSQHAILALCNYVEDLETRLERAASRYTLAEEHIKILCDKAESSDKCLLCGEDFTDNTSRDFPSCPVPSAREYLDSPEPFADAVTRGAFRDGDLPICDPMTESTTYNICPPNFADLELIGTVPKIDPGQSVIWSTAGKQNFIYRDFDYKIPDHPIQNEFLIVQRDPISVLGYRDIIADFEMHPRMFECHRPDFDSQCVLTSCVHNGAEQFASNAGMLIFHFCEKEPICINWPTFDAEHPILLKFENPMQEICPSFSISLHVLAPKDFNRRWRKD